MDTKHKIIEAALRVFLAKGFEKASMNDIVKEAAVTKGGIYHYFKNKEELFHETVIGFSTHIDDWFKEIISKSNSFRDILESFLKYNSETKEMLRNLAGNSGKAEHNYYHLLLQSIEKFPDIKDYMKKMYEKYVDYINSQILLANQKGELNTDINTETAASMIVSLIEGIMLMGLIDEKYNSEKFNTDLVNMIIKTLN